MMKKMMALSVAMSALLLAGCGAQQAQPGSSEKPSAEKFVMTMEELQQKNALEEVLKQHTSMSYTTS